MSLFRDLLGQPLAVSLLTSALRSGRLAPAYLFQGPEGVGRTLAAERFLEGIVTGGQEDPRVRRRLRARNHPDLLWVEPTYQVQGRLIPRSRALEEGVSRRAEPQVRLEQVRQITAAVARPPLEAARSLVVLEGAEAMAEAAANALLKTLEEPGSACLLLICAAPDQLLSTIRSRCQAIPFRPLDRASFQAVLDRLPMPDGDPASDQASGEDADLHRDLLERMAAGSPGALLAHRQHWHELPPELVTGLCALGASRSDALRLAAAVSDALDVESQLWLVEWWRWWLWTRQADPAVQLRLQRLQRHLRAYVQPRLAWEVAALEVAALIRRWPSCSPGAAAAPPRPV
ncbi:DNA polymerase III subunit delta' [Synechococcus sp. RSCCF101]|uniref:DNA polymerase III subunit delta' n=1 Tax=Synechococcus sp. RSCCF101 TaxID=2511069 RepID=UPI00351A402B